MDGQRFDTLARALAAKRSRRGTLGIVGASLLGALGLGSRGAAAVCADLGTECGGDITCCDPYVCLVTGPFTPQTCGTCIGQGETCNNLSLVCCSGLKCGDFNTCESVSCVESGGSCGVGDCCAGLDCQSGTCGRQCAEQCSACETCVDGACTSTCTDGQFCDAVDGCLACQVAADGCDSDDQCCAGLTCQAGACAAPPVCGAVGAGCQGEEDCCDGLTCLDLECSTPLPSCGQTGDDCFQVACCQGFACDSFDTCQPTDICRAFGATCAEGLACCDGLMCQSGSCCKLPRQACEGPQDCCVIQGDDDSGTCGGGVCSGTAAPEPTATSPAEPTPEPTEPSGGTGGNGGGDTGGDGGNSSGGNSGGDSGSGGNSSGGTGDPGAAGAASQLPNTGSGSDVNHIGSLIATIAAGGAAALFGARKLRANQEYVEGGRTE